MKTTIDFPNDLLHRAKIAAAQRKITLRELVFQGLDHAIRHPAPELEEERKAALKRLLKRMKASNTKPMAPLRREELHDR